MFGKAVSGVCSDLRALHSTHREREIDREWEIDREKERETERGVERREWRAQKKREKRINVGRAWTTAGKPDRSFFFPPFSSPTLSLSSSPCSFPIHCLRVCQHEAEPTYLAPGARSLSQYARLKGWMGGRQGGWKRRSERARGEIV